MLKKLWNKRELSIYINDNECQIITNKLITFSSKAINDSQVIYKETFLKDLKQHHLEYPYLYSLIPVTLTIYLNSKITEKEIIYYNYLFAELNIAKLKVQSILDLLDLSKNYLVYNKDTKYLISNQNIITLPNNLHLNTLKELISTPLFIFGNNKITEQIPNFYIINNGENFIANKIKNIAKS